MESSELAELTTDPIQKLGLGFYFDPLTAERAKELGMNVFEFYGLGRGGVLGDVDAEVVDRAFTFFHPRTMDFLFHRARAKADPVATAREHVLAAYAFADRTFGALDVDLLADVGALARRVTSEAEPGHHLLATGYLQYQAPASAVHAAYLGTILLRELRGGAHIDAVAQVGLTPLEACYLQDDSVFKLHGYSDDDVPPVTPELEAKKIHAEVVTSELMARYFSVLSGDERQRLADGTLAMFAALSDPVAVTS